MVTIFNKGHGDKFEYALRRVEELYNDDHYSKSVKLSSNEIESTDLEWGRTIHISNMKQRFIVNCGHGVTRSELNSNLKQIILNEGDVSRFSLIFAKNLIIRIILIRIYPK